MAIPFSLPAERGGTRPRHHHRESLASSTGRSHGDQVSFTDLNLSSQLLYLAMLEAMRVVQDLAAEASDHDSDDDDRSEEDEADDSQIYATKKTDQDADDDTVFEECPKYDNIVDTGLESSECEDQDQWYGDYEEKKPAQMIPDILSDLFTGPRDIIADDPVPDIIASVLNNKAVINDERSGHNLPDIVPNTDKSSSRIIPSNHSCSPHHNHQIIRHAHPHFVKECRRQEKDDQKVRNCWRQIGRDLARIADDCHKRHDAVVNRRVADFVGMRGVERREENDDNGSNHHLHNRLCHPSQSASNNNIFNPAYWSLYLTNIAVNGLLYIVNNVL